MIEVPIYIPREGANAIATMFAPHSAIVGQPDDPPGDRVVVYYEGNLYGASNMITFADRAMFAYWRMRDHYPTVAMMAAPRNQLRRVATLYPEHGRVEVSNGGDLIRLARWITGKGIDASHAELAREFAVEGVRPDRAGQR